MGANVVGDAVGSLVGDVVGRAVGFVEVGGTDTEIAPSHRHQRLSGPRLHPVLMAVRNRVEQWD